MQTLQSVDAFEIKWIAELGLMTWYLRGSKNGAGLASGATGGSHPGPRQRIAAGGKAKKER